MRVVAEQYFRISGSGSQLPARRVTADELDARCGLPANWCREHIGIESRYECQPPETMITLGASAIAQALDDAGLAWKDIDLLVDCSTSQFRPIPCNAAHYQAHFGRVAQGIPCFDVHSTCLGSLVALHLLNGMFATGTCRHAVVVAAETGHGGVNYAEPESACLIGDGAAALVLSQCAPTSRLAYCHETYAEYLELCHVEGGGHKLPVFQYSDSRDADYRFSMDGPAVFRVALQHLKPMIEALVDDWEIATSKPRDQLHFVPHQASPRALKGVQRMFGVDDAHYHRAVHEVGNMVAASLPFMIHRVRQTGCVTGGETILAMGTSAGYSQAALIFEL